MKIWNDKMESLVNFFLKKKNGFAWRADKFLRHGLYVLSKLRVSRIYLSMAPGFTVDCEHKFFCDIVPGMEIFICVSNLLHEKPPACAVVKNNNENITIEPLKGSDDLKLTKKRCRTWINGNNDVFLIRDPMERLTACRVIYDSCLLKPYCGVQFFIADGSTLTVFIHSRREKAALPYHNIPQHKFSAMLFDCDGELVRVMKG